MPHDTDADARIAELERTLIAVHDGYQHKLDDLRGTIRGLLIQQDRLLTEAQDALDADGPFLTCVRERLVDARAIAAQATQATRAPRPSPPHATADTVVTKEFP